MLLLIPVSWVIIYLEIKIEYEHQYNVDDMDPKFLPNNRKLFDY